jgi:hypothetical protein
MIKMTNVCPYCGEEWWEAHECEGTRRAAAEEAAAREEAERNARIEESLAHLEIVMQEYNQPVCDSQGIWDNFASWGDNPDKDDPVSHPKHYTSHPSGVECIDITKHYNFQVGNAMKYLWRQGLKNDPGLDPVEKQIQDCEKAIWYIQSYIDDLKGTK